MFRENSNEWKTWKTRYMRILVIMGILYVLDEDLKIPNENYEIIEDPNLKNKIDKLIMKTCSCIKI